MAILLTILHPQRCGSDFKTWPNHVHIYCLYCVGTTITTVLSFITNSLNHLLGLEAHIFVKWSTAHFMVE